MDSATPQFNLAPEVTKRVRMMALLERNEGASLDDMFATSGCVPHTAQAAPTGLRKSGYVIERQIADGVRRYRITAPTQ